MQMKQKKLIIFMPSIEGGGVEKNLFLISSFLANKINDVYLITASKKYKNRFNKKINLILPQFDFWDRFGRKIKYIICLLMLLRNIILQKNVLVLCFQANIYCTIVCKIFNKKIIVRSNSSPSGWSNNIIKRFIFRIVLNKADAIIVNSLEFKRELKNTFNVNARCIYNPLNKKEILKHSKRKINNIFNKKKCLKIINVGRYVDQKDQITLLKSLNLLKNKINFSAVIIGHGILKNYLKKYIYKNNMQNKIKLIDFKNNPYPFIKQADLFVLSSKYEGLPNVVLEAMVLKKFVISSACPTGPKEILMDGKLGFLFKVGNYNKLAEKIFNYSKNKTRYNKNTKYAYRMLHRFDYELNLKKYLKSVNSLIKIT